MSADNKQLRILFGVPEASARGGINACEPPFISAVRNSGSQVREEVYLFDNSDDIPLTKRIRQVVSAASRLLEAASSEQFDVIHLNTSFELRSLLRDAFTLWKLRSERVFLKFHGSNTALLVSRNPIVRALTSYVLGKAAGVGVLSSDERSAFIAAGFSQQKIFRVKNAVEPLDVVPVRSEGGGATKLLFVSRLVRTKGLDDAVKAVKLLSDSGRKVQLDVLGSGEAKAPAEKLAAQLGITDIVRFHGHVSEEKVRGFYASSDILVFPTFHDEGFPMVVFGALRFGTPIVTTKIRAAADYLTENANCLFCNPHDPQSVADAVAKLIDDAELAARIRENNLRLSREFIPDVTASEYLEIYRRIGSETNR